MSDPFLEGFIAKSTLDLRLGLAIQFLSNDALKNMDRSPEEVASYALAVADDLVAQARLKGWLQEVVEPTEPPQ